jgi:hypothetical protein
MGLFTPEQAKRELARLRPVLEELVVVRADVVELAAALAAGGEPTLVLLRQVATSGGSGSFAGTW